MKDVKAFIEDEMTKIKIKTGLLVFLKLVICVSTGLIFGVTGLLFIITIILIDSQLLKKIF